MGRILFALFLLALMPLAQALERWGTAEISLTGPASGNPFVDVSLSASFRQGAREIKVDGFYDGDGVYRIRFMPDTEGVWEYETASNQPALSGKRGKLTVGPAGPGNHGPVGVRDTYHFAYADGTPFRQLGSTSYAWTHQPEAQEEQTLKTLAASPFNKLRMAVFPNSGVKPLPTRFPFPAAAGGGWNTSRFEPGFFQHLERRIGDLRALGIEADVILFHPYDKGTWGFDRLPDSVNQRYLRYVVARLAAYRNVWWSMANEFDFMKEKSGAEWDSYFQTVQRADPYQHLRSIHNGLALYDHNKPWVTHVSVQSGAIAEHFERAVLLRDVYNKPVVYDEVKYEGRPDFARRWGRLSAQDLLLRFWHGTVAGTYVGHSETFGDAEGRLWLGNGGSLQGESPARLAFLRQILADAPPLDPIDKWQGNPFAGKPGQYYLGYFGREAPSDWPFVLHRTGLKEGMRFRAEVIDTWNMKISPVPGVFEVKRRDEYNFADKDGRSIALPARPFMALRIVRVP